MRKQEDFPEPPEHAGGRRPLREAFMSALGSLVVFSCTAILAPGSTLAGQPIPGEVGLGWFFHLTHLPIVVYVILFIICILSVVNLWFQTGRVVGRVGPHSLWDSLKDLWHGNLEWGLSERHQLNSQKHKSKKHAQSSFRIGSEAVVVGEVVGVPRLSSSSRNTSDPDAVLTPLDGIDHTLPQFVDSALGQSGPKEKSAPAPDQEGKQVSFRFSSAVDIPAQKEMDRRDKTVLVVSGFVTDRNGKGLPSVLVYLTDLEGNRVGQSCRTSPETGEYKVLVNEPGKYFLRAHKRGMMVENVDGISLPMESGRIEGLNFSMIPDGCVVKGRVLVSETSEPVPDTVVRCRSRLGDYTGETLSDADGNFSIVGVPPNCECYIEILDGSGKRLHVTDHFETVQKSQISLAVNLPQKNNEHLRSNDPPQTVSRVDANV